jgi:hypothetical protein
MKEIYAQLKYYWLHQVKWPYIISLWAFLAIAIYFNYQYDFENSILRVRMHTPSYPVLVAAYYLIPYLYAFIMYAVFYNSWHIFKQKEFWIPVLVGIAALTLNEVFYWHYQWIENNITVHEDMQFTANCMAYFVGAFLYCLPPFIYWLYYDKKTTGLYGFSTKRFKVKPYVIMLGCMLPLLIAASFTDGFKSCYPFYTETGFSAVNGLPQWVSVALFEFCYGLNFVAVEFVFRGFMVMALIEVMGADSILPMATLYCVYHFGKPAGECIGAFFGATILGVIAYNSRSIYGGIMIHIGIAFMMELLAFLQKCNF